MRKKFFETQLQPGNVGSYAYSSVLGFFYKLGEPEH